MVWCSVMWVPTLVARRLVEDGGGGGVVTRVRRVGIILKNTKIYTKSEIQTLQPFLSP